MCTTSIRHSALAAMLLMGTAPLANAYDLLLVPAQFHSKPGVAVDVALLHGSLHDSGTAVRRDRMKDVTILVNGKASRPADSQWSDTGNVATLRVVPSESGVHALGVSLEPKVEEWSPQSFDAFLKFNRIDALPVGQRPKPAANGKFRLRYTKHARTLVQVGSKTTNDFAQALSYPAEIIPSSNPLVLKVGDSLKFKVLLAGKPAADTVVHASYKGYRESPEGTEPDRMEYSDTLRTDSAGIATVRLTHAGPWMLTSNFLSKATDGGAEFDQCQTSLTFWVQ